MGKTIFKGIILAGGYGTRFLPVTKSIPKEMLPIVNLPSIHFIIEEFIEAGIKDIIVITNRNKKALEDYFDNFPELENSFKENNNNELLKKIKPHDLNVAFIRQKNMTGPGDALLLAEPFIGNSPFIVAFPDDIVLYPIGLSKQLKNLYKKYKKNIISLMEVNDDVSRYGVIIPGQELTKNSIYINGMIEKPKKGTEPSKIISIGRYLFNTEYIKILKILRKTHKHGEFFLTDAIEFMSKEKKFIGLKFSGKRLDTGDPIGYIKSILHYISLQNNYKGIIKDFLKEVNVNE